MPSFDEYLRNLQAQGIPPRYLELQGSQDLGFAIPAVKKVYEQFGVGTDSRFAREWYSTLRNLNPETVLSFYIPMGYDVGDPALRARMAEDWAVSAATYGRSGGFPIPTSQREVAHFLQASLSPNTVAGYALAYQMQNTKQGGGLDSAYSEYSTITSAISIFSGTAVSSAVAGVVSGMLWDVWDQYQDDYLNGRIGNMSFTEYLAKTSADALRYAFPGLDLNEVVNSLQAAPLPDLAAARQGAQPQQVGQQAGAVAAPPAAAPAPVSAPASPPPAAPSQSEPILLSPEEQPGFNPYSWATQPPQAPQLPGAGNYQGKPEAALPSLTQPPSVTNPYPAMNIAEAIQPWAGAPAAPQYGMTEVAYPQNGTYRLRGKGGKEYQVQLGNEAGNIVWYSPDLSAAVFDNRYVVAGPILDYWGQTQGFVGAPVSNPIRTTDGGVVQLFSKAALYYRDGYVIPVSPDTLDQYLPPEAVDYLKAQGYIPR